ncbi:YeiH family protein [Histomonas meleagridis]|uniref:YeiH family protein n=1 Tax=Histomonas meleagridis TaxID=135588 RepID=UPI00355989CE|nr:YeiH family protein [Histomonas meleagridis]KAH0801760.1 YeiH family protein [Histomonas meleagridis]
MSSSSEYSSNDELKPLESPEENDEDPKVVHIPTIGEQCKNYWKQFIDPSVWRGAPICLAIGAGFWGLSFIPNYDACKLSPSIFALIFGVILGAIPPVQRFYNHPYFKNGVAFSKQMFMRLSVILYGFKTKLNDIAEVGWGGAISAILMVFVTFFLGIGLGILLKIKFTQSSVISTGYSICGIAAVLSSAGIFDSSSTEISLASILVIIGGFLDIIIYPSIYSAHPSFFTDRTFGQTAGISIKEIAHTVSIGLSCSDTVSKYAMIVKMFKVLLLPFLLILISIVGPMIKRKIQHEEKEVIDDAPNSCVRFFGKVSIPVFAFIFILMTIVNTYANVTDEARKIIDHIVVIALSASMFCVGLTTDLKQLAKATNWRPFVMFIIMYVWVFLFGWLLIYVFKNV